MKSKLTLILLCFASISFAQYGYPYDETGLGIGVGYNFNSVVGKEIHPIELSLAYRIYDEHLLRLYVPLFNQRNSFKTDGSSEGMINTSLETKKRLFGIGFDYDYALHTYSFFDFVIGARFEYALCKERSDLFNSYMWTEGGTGKDRIDKDDVFRERKTRNFVVSPNAGFRLRLNRVYIDAKVLMSMLSYRGDVHNVVETRRDGTSETITTKEDTIESISNNFKLKPAVVMSLSYFF